MYIKNSQRGYEAPVFRLVESCIPGISVRGSTEKGGRGGGVTFDDKLHRIYVVKFNYMLRGYGLYIGQYSISISKKISYRSS